MRPDVIVVCGRAAIVVSGEDVWPYPSREETGPAALRSPGRLPLLGLRRVGPVVGYLLGIELWERLRAGVLAACAGLLNPRSRVAKFVPAVANFAHATAFPGCAVVEGDAVLAPAYRSLHGSSTSRQKTVQDDADHNSGQEDGRAFKHFPSSPWCTAVDGASIGQALPTRSPTRPSSCLPNTVLHARPRRVDDLPRLQAHAEARGWSLLVHEPGRPT